MYIDHITRNTYPNNKTLLAVPCPFCGKVTELEIPTDEWLDGLKAYENGMHVQYAWPNLSPAQRELFITGICEDCWPDNI